jgi:hypothetical protein
VTVSAKASGSRRAAAAAPASRRAAGGVDVNVTIAMDNQAQASAAVTAMTITAINSRLQALSLPSATLLSAPAVRANGPQPPATTPSFSTAPATPAGLGPLAAPALVALAVALSAGRW